MVYFSWKFSCELPLNEYNNFKEKSIQISLTMTLTTLFTPESDVMSNYISQCGQCDTCTVENSYSKHPKRLKSFSTDKIQSLSTVDGLVSCLYYILCKHFSNPFIHSEEILSETRFPHFHGNLMIAFIINVTNLFNPCPIDLLMVLFVNVKIIEIETVFD